MRVGTKEMAVFVDRKDDRWKVGYRWFNQAAQVILPPWRVWVTRKLDRFDRAHQDES